MLLLRALTLIGATLLSIPALALAQEDVSSTEDAEARANFDAGRVAFSDARYDDALGYFERSHALSHRPELLYNIGLCHDRLGHDAEALAAFEGYLAGVPAAENRAEVEQRIATARERVRRAEAVAAGGSPTPAPAAPGMDPTGWILLGVGVAVLGGGAAMVGVGRSDVAAVESSMGTLSWTQANEVVSRGDALTIAGAVSLGVGAALAATGLALALGGSSSGAGEAVTLRVGPGTVGIGGTF